jgi:hypothetical protein
MTTSCAPGQSAAIACAAAGVSFHRRGPDHCTHLRHQPLQAFAARDAHTLGAHRVTGFRHLAGGVGQHHVVRHLGVPNNSV